MPQSFFIAVGQDGLRASSTDGVTWSNKQIGKEGETYRAAAAGNGVLLAVGSYGGKNILAVSTDGATWNTSLREANYSKYIRGLAVGNGLFLGLGGDPGSAGDSKPFVLLSKDGVTWEGPTPIVGRHILQRATWGNDRFVAVGDRGRRATSPDGKTWTDAEKVKAIDTLVDVAFGNGVFVGVGLHGLRMTTQDGLTWTDRQLGEEGEHLNSVMFAKDRFVAVGVGATYTSADGKNWERTPNDYAPQVAVFGDGVFVGAAWKGRIFVSNDAIKWRETHKFEQHVMAIAWGQAKAKQP